MTELTTMPVEIERDRWGRPMVIPPGQDKAVGYTRCTTFVGSIEDTYNLSRWQQRMVALGLADRRDLLLSVAAHRDDKKRLNAICEDAMEAAKAHAAATTGTALHAFTERIDRGLDLGVVPEEYVADLAAYTRATEPLQATHIEQFCVLDDLKIGGTPDRVVKYGGKKYIADLKTGSISWGYLKIAAQLAVYARSKTYDVATRERGMHGAEIDRGIIIHLPAGTGECTLYWVDLLEGWNAVIVSRQIREKRSLSFKDLVSDFDAPVAPINLGDVASTYVVPSVQGQLDVPGIERIPATLAEQIVACADRETVLSLWKLHANEWTDDLTELTKRHLASL